MSDQPWKIGRIYVPVNHSRGCGVHGGKTCDCDMPPARAIAVMADRYRTALERIAKLGQFTDVVDLMKSPSASDIARAALKDDEESA